mmetsp:Transcript_21261/g.47520  ORF Transcript_21261/g.47520 Transcript_21261/m.47520 type:complete len:349 (-) Transcript_21261:7-1053(-)
MSTGQLTVALFYKYVRVRVGDLDALAAQQTALTSTLGLTGRVRLAPEGINGHLSGPVAAITTYREHNEQNPLLSGIQYKLTQSDGDPFSGELFVVVRDEITATGQMQTQLPIALGGTGGKHLTAQEFHQAVLGCQAGTDAATGRRQVLIDTRNHYETAVGIFQGAVDPKIRTFAQFPGWVAANEANLAGADVFMYCTGGIRCEKASAYLCGLGVAHSVSQLGGGIHTYLEGYSSEARQLGLATVGTAPGIGMCSELDVGGGIGVKACAADLVYNQGGGEGGLRQEEQVAGAGAGTGAAGSSVREAQEDLGEGDSSLWRGVNYTFDARYSSRQAGGRGGGAGGGESPGG